MAQVLLSQNIWKEITKSVKINRGKSFVAVAYFGKGGSKMLPMKGGSKLVVDASDYIVKTGLTNPTELLKLYKKGVRIYSFTNLHAKTFVIGTKLYIGSTNVSSNSANQLQEAVLSITDRNTVHTAKEFVESLCSIELGSEQLKQLVKIYRPPKFVGVRKSDKSKSKVINDIHIRIVSLQMIDYPEGHEKALKDGSLEAKRKRILKSQHYTEEFNVFNVAKFHRREAVIQIVDSGKQKMVLPPSIVIHTKSYLDGNGKRNCFVFVETLDKRSKSIETVKQSLSGKEKKALDRDGFKSSELSAKLISLWK